MEDIRLALISGTDIPIEQCQLVIHQPKIKEISLIGEKDFFIGTYCLNLNKSMYLEDESRLQNTSNFQIFMTAMLDKRVQDKKEDVEKVISLILPNYKVAFLPNTIILTKDGQTSVIDENNFDIFQSTLSQVFCIKSGMNQESFNPKDKKAQDIANKLQRARQKVAEQNGDTNASTLVTYMSSLSVALQVPLTTLSEYTLFQLYDTMQRYQLYLAWDLDCRSRLAGGKPDEKPENWMKNIH